MCGGGAKLGFSAGWDAFCLRGSAFAKAHSRFRGIRQPQAIRVQKIAACSRFSRAKTVFDSQERVQRAKRGEKSPRSFICPFRPMPSNANFFAEVTPPRLFAPRCFTWNTGLDPPPRFRALFHVERQGLPIFGRFSLVVSRGTCFCLL